MAVAKKYENANARGQLVNPAEEWASDTLSVLLHIYDILAFSCTFCYFVIAYVDWLASGCKHAAVTPHSWNFLNYIRCPNVVVQEHLLRIAMDCAPAPRPPRALLRALVRPAELPVLAVINARTRLLASTRAAR